MSPICSHLRGGYSPLLLTTSPPYSSLPLLLTHHHLSSLLPTTSPLFSSPPHHLTTSPLATSPLTLQVLFGALREKFPEVQEKELLKVVGNLVYYRFVNPTIVAPERFDMVDRRAGELTNDQRRNLGSVAKILQFAASKKGFGEESEHLMCLNPFIVECHEKFKGFFLAVCGVAEPEQHFLMDEWTVVEQELVGVRQLRQGDVDRRPSDEHGLGPLVHEEVLLGLGHAAHRQEDALELLVALHDEGVEAHEVLRLLAEALLAGGALQDLGHRAEVPALVVGQLAGPPVHHVEPLR